MTWNRRRKRRARLRRVGYACATLAGLAGGLTVAGVLLPAEHESVERTLVDRPPETVWRVLIDLDGMPRWRSDLTALERLPDLDGRPAWREIGGGRARVMRLATAEPPRRLVIERTVDGHPGLPVRTVELVSTARGTLVTVSERGRVGNPLGRVLVRLRVRRGALDRFLHDLDRRLGGGAGQVATAGEPMPLH
jgi:uncharacterized protein YndB with AHSA1/START domain